MTPMLQRVPPRPATPTKISARRSMSGLAQDDQGPVSASTTMTAIQPTGLPRAQPFAMPAQAAPAPTTAPRSIVQPVMPAPVAAAGGDVNMADVNSYVGSRYGHASQGIRPPSVLQPVPGYRPQPTAEASADRILRSQFGPPPNERGQIDVARGGLNVPSAAQTAGAFEQGQAIPQAQVPPVVSRNVPAPVAAPASTPAPQAAPVAPAQQTEAANPLSGTSTTQPGGTTEELNPAKSLGFSSRGSVVPGGADAMPSGNVGGSGIYARTFNSPVASGIYNKYVRSLFGPEAGVA